jgi:hypothetical protein
MARLLLLLIVVAGLYFFIRWITQQPARIRWQMLAITLAMVLLVLVLTGRAHWLAALFAAVLPFLRGLLTLAGNWPFIRRLLGSPGGAKPGQAPTGGQTSTVQSKFIRMTLDHDSGEINGEILAGQFAGKMLDQLDLDTLMQLLEECQDDDESVALLQAYLDRVYEDSWHEQSGSQSKRQEANADGAMSREEALQILGLTVDASTDDIIEAHRRLIQKLHPDRGGSAYLAARINLAKDILLGR